MRIHQSLRTHSGRDTWHVPAEDVKPWHCAVVQARDHPRESSRLTALPRCAEEPQAAFRAANPSAIRVQVGAAPRGRLTRRGKRTRLPAKEKVKGKFWLTTVGENPV